MADFGFASYKNVDALKSYRGTMTYMAPEIKESKTYKGTQVDVFSLGVILFIIVQGIFPFKEARREEYFYGLLLNGRIEHYWTKVNGGTLSQAFKDLVLKLFSYDGDQRPTTEQIRNSAWMNDSSYDKEATRQLLMTELARKNGLKAAARAQTLPPISRGSAVTSSHTFSPTNR